MTALLADLIPAFQLEASSQFLNFRWHRIEIVLRRLRGDRS